MNDIDKQIKEAEERLKELKAQKIAASENAEGASVSSQQNPYAVPVAILVAGLLIAGAVFYSGGSGGQQAGNVVDPTNPTTPTPRPSRGNVDNIRPITEKDHIRGDRNAPIKIVEFSDFECPFCKRFHSTMQRVMDEYGKDGKVAWVYRHFPLDSIHPFKARNEAKASECANELGGNEAFWKYADKIFEITPSNNQLDQSLLPQIAEDIGLDRAKFEECMKSTKYDQHIEEDLQDAIASGGTGTPYSVLIAEDGKKYPISGAQPYSAVKAVIDIALKSSQ